MLLDSEIVKPLAATPTQDQDAQGWVLLVDEIVTCSGYL
jgi:hypothetical protein